MKLLVTGGSSFVGAHFCKMAARTHEVIALIHSTKLHLNGVTPVRVDLRRPREIESLRDIEPDVVVHIACKIRARGATKEQDASELAARVGVSRPTLTSLVNGLEEAGMLKRLPVPTDGRGISLEPTDKGIEAVARAERALSRRLLQLVDFDTARVVSDVVTALADALDRESEDELATRA